MTKETQINIENKHINSCQIESNLKDLRMSKSQMQCDFSFMSLPISKNIGRNKNTYIVYIAYINLYL